MQQNDSLGHGAGYDAIKIGGGQNCLQVRASAPSCGASASAAAIPMAARSAAWIVGVPLFTTCSRPLHRLFHPLVLFHRLFTAVLPLQNVRAIREAVGDEVDLMVHRAGGESSAILPALPSQSLLKRLRKGEGGA